MVLMGLNLQHCRELRRQRQKVCSKHSTPNAASVCVCVWCLRGRRAVCLCGRVVGATLWKRRALMNPTYPASPAAQRPRLSITLNGHLLFIEPLFLALYNFSPLPLEELQKEHWEERWRQKIGKSDSLKRLKNRLNQVHFCICKRQFRFFFSQFWPSFFAVMKILLEIIAETQHKTGGSSMKGQKLLSLAQLSKTLIWK